MAVICAYYYTTARPILYQIVIDATCAILYSLDWKCSKNVKYNVKSEQIVDVNYYVNVMRVTSRSKVKLTRAVE